MKTEALTVFFFLLAFWASAQDKPGSTTATSVSKTTKKTPATKNKSEEELAKKIMRDLVDMNIITDTNEVTFTLSDKKMEVNHRTQPDEIFAQFKEKYLSQLNVHFPELLPTDSTTVTQ